VKTNTGYSSTGSYQGKTSTVSYQSTANIVVRANSYYDVSSAKTYKPLYVYYLPPDYYNEEGYYSETYSLKYYDGYGYNFYYGEYGYYEYSVNPSDVTKGKRFSTFLISGAALYLVLIFPSLVAYI
jgi:hypothetical protein